MIQDPWADQKLQARFWRKVSRTDGCWLWTGTKDRAGYGRIGLGRRKAGNIRAHRLSWMIANRSNPDSQYVLHKCDTPSCVNPQHLFLGTHAVNMADARSKDRFAVGDRNPVSKLNAESVRQIRCLRADGLSLRKLSQRFGVAMNAIESVLYGKTWRHVQ